MKFGDFEMPLYNFMFYYLFYQNLTSSKTIVTHPTSYPCLSCLIPVLCSPTHHHHFFLPLFTKLLKVVIYHLWNVICNLWLQSNNLHFSTCLTYYYNYACENQVRLARCAARINLWKFRNETIHCWAINNGKLVCNIHTHLNIVILYKILIIFCTQFFLNFLLKTLVIYFRNSLTGIVSRAQKSTDIPKQMECRGFPISTLIVLAMHMF